MPEQCKIQVLPPFYLTPSREDHETYHDKVLIDKNYIRRLMTPTPRVYILQGRCKMKKGMTYKNEAVAKCKGRVYVKKVVTVAS